MNSRAHVEAAAILGIAVIFLLLFAVLVGLFFIVRNGGWIPYENGVGCAQGNGVGFFGLARPGGPLGHVGVGHEDNAIVAGVGHIQVTFLIDGQPLWVLEAAHLLAETTQFADRKTLEIVAPDQAASAAVG